MIRLKLKGLLPATFHNFYVSGVTVSEPSPVRGAYPVSLLFSQAGLRQGGVFPVLCNAYVFSGFV
ncbi:hypothetical protein HYI78_001710 [Salmonella enterica]|nr:hypothetical protein [Salmonella enterica]